jgi:peptidyl-prolyl cis-trans isomerase SDCCAG10
MFYRKSVKSEIEKMEEEIRRLTRKRNNESDSEDETARKKAKGPSLLSQELSKYAAGRGRHSKGKKKDETSLMDAMNSFRGKLKQMGLGQADEGEKEEVISENKPEETKTGEEGGQGPICSSYFD